MTYLARNITKNIHSALQRGKSILLLGPRQTGKTTLIEQAIGVDIQYSFAKASIRQRYESDPRLLELELEQQIQSYAKPPLVFLDEVQKIPAVMDVVQHLIDDKKAQFILSGSSARKLKYGRQINLLPGRVVSVTMPPLLYSEMQSTSPTLESILLYGTLPGIVTLSNDEDRETDLYSYVTTYLEDEIRAEAAVRNIGHFTRFLEISAGEAGKQLNFTKLSQDIGVADTTITNYYQILEDSLIVSRIDPITNGHTKRRLIKSPKYLFFDLGVRRAAANEGIRLPRSNMGDLFEQYVGIELIHLAPLYSPQIKIRYWRDTAGPEVDFVLDYAQQWVPIEVKFTESPDRQDARHLIKFMTDYPEVKQAYVVCRTPRPYSLSDNIIALPWQDLSAIFETLLR